MPQINQSTLILAIQSIDKQIQVLHEMAEVDVVKEDDEFLKALHSAAEDLEQAYQKAYQETNDLPAYSQLVIQRDE